MMSLAGAASALVISQEVSSKVDIFPRWRHGWYRGEILVIMPLERLYQVRGSHTGLCHHPAQSSR